MLAVLINDYKTAYELRQCFLTVFYLSTPFGHA